MTLAKLKQHRLFFKGIKGRDEEGTLILEGDQHELRPGVEVKIIERKPGTIPEETYVLCRYIAKGVPNYTPSYEWMPLSALDIIEVPVA